MSVDLESIRKATLGKLTDLSYITDEIVAEGTAKATEAKGPDPKVAPSVMTYGNTLYRTGTNWFWRPDCQTAKWLRWGGNLRWRDAGHCGLDGGPAFFQIEYW